MIWPKTAETADKNATQMADNAAQSGSPKKVKKTMFRETRRL